MSVPLEKPCPTCGAGPGQFCTDPSLAFNAAASRGQQFHLSRGSFDPPAGSTPLEVQRMALGQRRMAEHIEHNGRLQVMALMLNMTVSVTPSTGYTDEAIAAIVEDADDLEDAAHHFAEWARTLARDWRAQRQENRDG